MFFKNRGKIFVKNLTYDNAYKNTINFLTNLMCKFSASLMKKIKSWFIKK